MQLQRIIDMGNGRTLKVAVLECERLQEHLAPAVYARTGGYLQLLQQAFTHVYAHASSILHPQINVPPKVSFTGGWSILSNYSTTHPPLTLQICLTQHLTCTTFIGFICTCLCRSLCVTEIGTRRIYSQWAMVGFSDVAPCTETLHGLAEGVLSEFDSGFAQHLCAIVGCHI